MERVPILKIGEILLVSIQIDMEDQVALQLQDDLAERIVVTGCHGVIIDISGLDIVDSFVGRTLATIASTTSDSTRKSAGAWSATSPSARPSNCSSSPPRW